MTITVRGEKKEFEKELTVRELLRVGSIENPLYVTVTVNDEFIRSTDFDTFLIHDGDVVEFLYFMGGGC